MPAYKNISNQINRSLYFMILVLTIFNTVACSGDANRTTRLAQEFGSSAEVLELLEVTPANAKPGDVVACEMRDECRDCTCYFDNVAAKPADQASDVDPYSYPNVIVPNCEDGLSSCTMNVYVENADGLRSNVIPYVISDEEVIEECNSDQECPDGFSCSNGTCSEIIKPVETDCSKNPDICVEGEHCFVDTCVADEPLACENTAFCKENFHDQSVCLSTGYCGSPLVWIPKDIGPIKFNENILDFFCDGDGDCAEGKRCNRSHFCEEKPITTIQFKIECSKTEQCGYGEFCNSIARCQKVTSNECTGNDECGNGRVCDHVMGQCTEQVSCIDNPSVCEGSGRVCNTVLDACVQPTDEQKVTLVLKNTEDKLGTSNAYVFSTKIDDKGAHYLAVLKRNASNEVEDFSLKTYPNIKVGGDFEFASAFVPNSGELWVFYIDDKGLIRRMVVNQYGNLDPSPTNNVVITDQNGTGFGGALTAYYSHLTGSVVLGAKLKGGKSYQGIDQYASAYHLYSWLFDVQVKKTVFTSHPAMSSKLNDEVQGRPSLVSKPNWINAYYFYRNQNNKLILSYFTPKKVAKKAIVPSGYMIQIGDKDIAGSPVAILNEKYLNIEVFAADMNRHFYHWHYDSDGDHWGSAACADGSTPKTGTTGNAGNPGNSTPCDGLEIRMTHQEEIKSVSVDGRTLGIAYNKANDNIYVFYNYTYMLQWDLAGWKTVSQSLVGPEDATIQNRVSALFNPLTNHVEAIAINQNAIFSRSAIFFEWTPESQWNNPGTAVGDLDSNKYDNNKETQLVSKPLFVLRD